MTNEQNLPQPPGMNPDGSQPAQPQWGQSTGNQGGRGYTAPGSSYPDAGTTGQNPTVPYTSYGSAQTPNTGSQPAVGNTGSQPAYDPNAWGQSTGSQPAVPGSTGQGYSSQQGYQAPSQGYQSSQQGYQAPSQPSTPSYQPAGSDSYGGSSYQPTQQYGAAAAGQYGATTPQPSYQASGAYGAAGQSYAPAGAGGYPPVAPTAPKKSKKGLFIGIGAGALVLAILAGFLIFQALKPKPSDVVKNFLTAVAAGKATEALSYALTPPADTSWITDERLKKAQDNGGGITEISVKESSSTTIYPSYKVGGKSTFASYDVQQNDKGEWKIVSVAADIDLKNVPSTIKMTVNGEELPAGTTKLTVLPGTYDFKSANKYIDLGDNKIVVEDPSGFLTDMYPIPQLTADGEAAALQAGKDALANCFAQKALAPTGCPISLKAASNQVVAESTIVWTMTNDPWKSVSFYLDSNDQSVATAYVGIQANFVADFTEDGKAAHANQDEYYSATVKVNLNDMTVTWEE